jgi:hypothetical protein
LKPEVKALFDECMRQKENCEYTALSFVIWLRALRWIQGTCIVVPIIFGALATWKVVTQTAPVAGAVFTLLATVIPITYRASKIDDAIRRYQRRSGDFTNLRDGFRRVAEIGMHKEFADFEKDTRPLFKRLERAREPMLTPPDWSFRAAQKKIKGGDYRHDYDERVSVN